MVASARLMVAGAHRPLFTDRFLASRWAGELKRFRGSTTDADIHRRLTDWATKPPQDETAAESAFLSVFFEGLWNYRAAGEGPPDEGHTRESKYTIPGTGEGGGTGSADLALGHFGRPGIPEVPQALCEFKDVRSALDRPQRRKGGDRSPVKQCADYLKGAADLLFGNEPIQPTWGLVTDMNEFRLYWRRTMPAQYQRFVLRPAPGDPAVSLLGDGDDAAFQRFVFWRLFQRDMLLSTGGPSPLARLLTEQSVQERAIEDTFYREYKAFRSETFQAIVAANPRFSGTRGKLVRLTQRLLDRCIFALFCEDMGAALDFPPDLLRDLLTGLADDHDHDPDDDLAWLKVKKLFAAMRDGGTFRDRKLNRFNGGLFAADPELESLHVPTRIFCAKGQGHDPEALARDPRTLLYFSATYNFGVSGGTLERTLGPETLGRIFEQSITELEFMEAEADGRPSVAALSRRRRDGVYYTPEWITAFIVEETVGAHLAELRRRLELDPLPIFHDDEIAHYRRARAAGRRDRRFRTERVEQYVANLDRFGVELDDFKLVDPACGSGAFLTQALDRLVRERRWLAAERERISGEPALFDADAVTKAVLSRNIYGVDINPESVELTRLALWLHTALPDRPLSYLDHNIRCGNSLDERNFYRTHREELYTPEQRERINAFVWKACFPEVFQRPAGKGGFDCVVGNPPYVKLQHFRAVEPDVAEFLATARRPDGRGPLYESTQTQNFDMYLPFIERGLALLNEGGRMGYIAPSVWLLNEHGAGLRRHLLATRRLERWVDFKDFPVFDEAMTYTALQFFRGRPTDAIRCEFVPDGELGAIAWSEPDAVVDYAALPADDTWLFLPARERDLLDRLARASDPLGRHPDARTIFQGIITSADHIYHLERLGPGRYRRTPKKRPPIEVELEDELMRPLVSGEEAKRYQLPVTRTHLLFPYDDQGARPRLYGPDELARRYPHCWQYLRSHESELRRREHGAFDDDQWYRFGRSQNIDKQRSPKLGVAQTVPEMRVFVDPRGSYCFNNVRVNGILVADEEGAYFLLGVLNSRVVDFVFRRIAKPKERRPSGAYFEANKQYIAPLPVPRADGSQRGTIAALARELQRLHTERRAAIDAVARCLASPQMRADPRPPKWLWADVGDIAAWSDRAPADLAGRARTAWARQAHHDRLAAHLAEIDACKLHGAAVRVELHAGELGLFFGDRRVLSGIHVDPREAPLLHAQWRDKTRDTFVSDATTAARLVDALLDLKTTDNPALLEKFAALDRELDDLERQIRRTERACDDLLYRTYGLEDADRALIEADTRTRWNARIPVPSHEQT